MCHRNKVTYPQYKKNVNGKQRSLRISTGMVRLRREYGTRYVYGNPFTFLDIKHKSENAQPNMNYIQEVIYGMNTKT